MESYQTFSWILFQPRDHRLFLLLDWNEKIKNSIDNCLQRPVRQKPGGAVEFLFCDLNLTLQHAVVVGVQVVELQVSLGREETVSLLGGEGLDLLVSWDHLGVEGEEMLSTGLNHDSLLVDGRELSRLTNIDLQGWNSKSHLFVITNHKLSPESLTSLSGLSRKIPGLSEGRGSTWVHS